MEEEYRSKNDYYNCKKSFVKTNVVYWLYTSIVKPVITYGCIGWWKAFSLRNNRKLLSKVQRCSALDFISKDLESTMQAFLDINLYILTVEGFIVAEAAKSFVRLFDSGFSITEHRAIRILFK